MTRKWAWVAVAAVTSVFVLSVVAYKLNFGFVAAPNPPVPASTPATVAPTSARPSPTPPAVQASYATATLLVDALAEQGLPCIGTPTPVANPWYATSLVDCGSTVIGVYSNNDRIAGAYAALVGAPDRTWQVHMAIGDNWTVSDSEHPQYVHQVAIRFGAKYRSTDLR